MRLQAINNLRLLGLLAPALLFAAPLGGEALVGPPGTQARQALPQRIDIRALRPAPGFVRMPSPSVASYGTGFEPTEGFAVGHIDGQMGWSSFISSASEAHVDTVNPESGVQHLRIARDDSLPAGYLVGAFSPYLGPQPLGPTTVSVEINISALDNGANYFVTPQAPSVGLKTAEVVFEWTGDILVLDDVGFGFEYRDTGYDWSPGSYATLLIDIDPSADTIEYYYGGMHFYSSVAGVFGGQAAEEVVLYSDNWHNPVVQDVGDFDRLSLRPTGSDQLTLEVSNTCITSGQLEVALWMRSLTQLVTGYQAFLEFDDTKLGYRPDLSGYTSLPFDDHFTLITDAETADGQMGTLWLDGNDSSSAGDDVDSQLATLVFDILADCDEFTVDFDLDSLYGFDSELSYQGLPLATVVVDTPTVVADSQAPVIAAPPDIAISADAGGCAEGTLRWLETFFTSPALCASQTPNCWYVDRYAPAEFRSAYFDGDYRLLHRIAAADHQASDFYNTQGRKYDVNMYLGETLTADLYIPAHWAGATRRADLWATTFDWPGNISGYPIVGFTTEDSNPRFRIYTQDIDQNEGNGYDAGWIDLGLPTGFVYDEWYTLEIQLTATSYIFRVIGPDGSLTFSDTITFDSVRFGNLILQAKNFAEDYDVYWDNVRLGFQGPEVTDACTDVSLYYQRSDDPFLTLDDPFPAGDTLITWTAIDACGNQSQAMQTVTVNAENDLRVEVELFGNITPVTRCIHFVLDDCGTTVDAPLDFYDHDESLSTALHATAIIQVPCDTPWTYLCVKDEQHTKWATTTLSVGEGDYVANTVPVLDGGDTDNDGDCDINDVTWYLAQNGDFAADGGCPWDGLTRDADFNNDGIVDSTGDYSFLARNGLTLSSCDCTLGFGASLDLLRTKAVLDASTLPAEIAARADLNEDGVIDYLDVEIFEFVNALPNALSSRMRAATNAQQ
ncbi:MAG: hypothetical protein ACF8NJ_11295 [Phycisphaerales bacterium JB038]